MADCDCYTAHVQDDESLIAALARVRSSCPALRDIYLPADIWAEYCAWHVTPDPVALHHSVLALALDRGYLARLTAPVHRFLVQANATAPGLRAQYTKDLKERWMLNPDPLRRHQLCRIYMGRITELQIAEWLEARGWTVSELEAFRKGPDITATHPEKGETDFEVKMVGTEDGDFQAIVQSLAGQPAGRDLSPYSAVNYLLFRAYEAAAQLRQSGRRRIAIVAVNSWARFQRQINNNWIDWKAPRFMTHDKESVAYIHNHRERYPGIDITDGLANTLAEIDLLWLLRRANGYDYYLERECVFRGA